MVIGRIHAALAVARADTAEALPARADEQM
jgi:hypothetical protein